jgi:hypothetical protein
MSLNTNALVTFEDLDNSMGLIKRGTQPYGSYRIATKANVGIYYYAQSAPLAGYANNECPVYQDIISVPKYNVTIYARASYSSPSQPVRITSRIGGNDWVTTAPTTLGNPSYTTVTTIVVPEGEFIYFGFRNVGDTNNVTYGVGNGGGYSGYCGQSAPYSTQFYANGSIYLNAKVNTSPPYIYSTC